jgi:hypothetical protein
MPCKGVRAEMVLGALERKLGKEAAGPSHDYLQQRLQYDADSERLMDADDRAVMMAWEGCASYHPLPCPVLWPPYTEISPIIFPGRFYCGRMVKNLASGPLHLPHSLFILTTCVNLCYLSALQWPLPSASPCAMPVQIAVSSEIIIRVQASHGGACARRCSFGRRYPQCRLWPGPCGRGALSLHYVLACTNIS